MSNLRELATPFHGKFVKAPPKGKYGEYVSHSTVNERALSVVGTFDMRVVEVVRGWTDEVTLRKGQQGERVYPARDNAVIGVVLEVTAVVDGRTVSVQEAGDVEGAAAQSDGANLKEAVSDAFKRCWMRLGLGLHLWSQDDYFLDKQLDKADPHKTFEVVRQRDGAGNLLRQELVDPETGEVHHVIEGQETLDYDEDNPERPFE